MAEILSPLFLEYQEIKFTTFFGNFYPMNQVFKFKPIKHKFAQGTPTLARITLTTAYRSNARTCDSGGSFAL